MKWGVLPSTLFKTYTTTVLSAFLHCKSCIKTALANKPGNNMTDLKGKENEQSGLNMDILRLGMLASH